MNNMRISPGSFMRFDAVIDALDARGLEFPSSSSSPRQRLLEAARQGGLTIESAARLLGAPTGSAGVRSPQRVRSRTACCGKLARQMWPDAAIRRFLLVSPELPT
jgi:hypothetical protein